jgi:hypothetical protein
MKNIITAIVFILTTGVGYAQFAQTAEETKFYNLLMQYRQQNGLAVIPRSNSLTYVAQVHARDVAIHPQNGQCIQHSWSQYSNGKWNACCFENGGANNTASCMWLKPQQLTPYKGYGFEILAETTGTMTAELALQVWQQEPGGAHIAVILNRAPSWTTPWNAIGVAIYNGVASVWFGQVAGN